MALELQVLRTLRFSIASFEIREASINVPAVFSAPGMPTTCSDATITFPGFRLDDLCYGAKQTCAMCGV